jgi:hypothetical protein
MTSDATTTEKYNRNFPAEDMVETYKESSIT